MQVDSNIIYNKDIIFIDTDNASFNDQVYLNFYVDILQPIKNAVYIKIIKSSITLNPNTTLSNSSINDNDPVYIVMNDYKRVVSFIRDNPSSDGNLFNYFDKIHIDRTSTYNLTNNSFIQNIPSLLLYSNEYSQTNFDVNDTSVYVLNPIEPNLKRFNIEIRNKNNKLIAKNEIGSFKMTICVYSLKKQL